MGAYIKTMPSDMLLTSIRSAALNSKTMPSIFVLVCSACIFFVSCFAQETTETQPSTDAANAFEWDTTSPTLTTSIGDPQVDNSISSRSNDDYSSFFANQWEPTLMPVKFPSYGDRIYNQNARYEMKDAVDLYPFLKRPDVYPSDWNDTIPPEYATYPLSTGYLPYPPPELFYPRPLPNGYPQRLRYPEQIESATYPSSSQSLDVSDQQNISASSPAAAFYRAPFPRFSPSPENTQQQFFNYPPLDFFLRNRNAVRNPDNAVPTTPFPYPPGFFPPGGPQLYPQVNIFVRPPYGDSESIPQDRLPERRHSLPPPGPFSPTAPTNLPPGTPVPLQPIPPAPQPNFPLPSSPFPYGYPPVRPPFPGLVPRPTSILPPIPTSPDNNLLEGPIPEVPSLPLKPVDASVPPTGDVPSVVNVDVFDPETPKSDDGPSGNIPYKFGYDMNDGRGTGQHREESADEAGVVTGSYGYRDLNGVYRLVTYIADKDGFRASVKTNEPGVANPGSADVAVLAERPPLHTIAEGLRRSNIDVTLSDEPTNLEALEKK